MTHIQSCVVYPYPYSTHTYYPHWFHKWCSCCHCGCYCQKPAYYPPKVDVKITFEQKVVEPPKKSLSKRKSFKEW